MACFRENFTFTYAFSPYGNTGDMGSYHAVKIKANPISLLLQQKMEKCFITHPVELQHCFISNSPV